MKPPVASPRPRPRRLAAAILVAAGLAAAALVPSAQAAGPKPSPTVTARLLTSTAHGVLKPGSRVSGRSLGTRVFVSATRGFALATVSGVTYPAQTTDGGASWRTDGPEFHIPAAQGPLVVTQVGAAPRKTYFAYGGPQGGNAVNVTTDGGRHWYQSFFNEVVLAMVHVRGKLIAVVQDAASTTGTTAVTWVYVSTDGGRHWHYDNNLGAS